MNALLNYSVIIAFVFLAIGMVIQIRKTLKRKSAKDISFYEVLARLLATFIFSAKYFVVSDRALIIGSSIFNITFLVYFTVICVVMIQGKNRP